jgi:hypothetical protein
MIVTTIYLDLLVDALKEIESDELLFHISTPSLTRPVPMVNAIQVLMRQATSTTLLPPRKHFPRMTGEHAL